MLGDSAEDSVMEVQVEEVGVESISENDVVEVREENEDDDVQMFNDGNLVDDTDGKLRYLYWCEKLHTTPVSQILKYLNGSSVPVNHYGISRNGLRALAHALQVNKSVEDISLESNNITDSGGLDDFFHILSGNKTIKSVNLSSNKIGSRGCKALSRFLLEKTCRIEELNLSNNRLTDKSAKCILSALEHNTSIKSLNLSRNFLTGKSSVVLCDFLSSHNMHLQSLDLSWNTLKGRGCGDLLKSLSQDGTLNSLNLGWNGIQDEGALLIAEFIGHLNIEELDLNGNGITDSGFIAILDALSNNDAPTLRVIRLGQNYIYEERYSSVKESSEFVDTASGKVYKNAPVEINSSTLKLGYSNLA
ncbi:leucine-rich repeat-containing protein [Chloropicon primus]|uniref:Leucine-rich repeat-containing protein n=1 Tax=Chloropicon primus TaxID=1764295 RepID=A0A5B8MHH3_9CHLO|nr:leucine-rich repeat-containing protein [Chloropicon primus]UPQ99300.1 leucine-rich repeat-containing protein [Chloropicon primus]|eukprot:QDZ20088.1 leucine-rich repeat-containing protein [Chloropicon primus]